MTRRRRPTPRAVLHSLVVLGVAASRAAALPCTPPQVASLLCAGTQSGGACFVPGPAAPWGQKTTTARPAWKQYHVPRRRGGLTTCFLGGGGRRRNPEEGTKNEEDGATTPQDGGAAAANAASSTAPARRVFVATPHHHGNSHLEGLLDLAGREKEEFVAAVVDLEHHMQLEVAEALIFNIRYVLRFWWMEWMEEKRDGLMKEGWIGLTTPSLLTPFPTPTTGNTPTAACSPRRTDPCPSWGRSKRSW